MKTTIQLEKNANNTKCSINASDYFIEVLENLNVDTIFGYPGASVVPLYNSLSKSKKIKHILCRHEQGAVHASEGYSRVKNKCGVVFTTSGPGFTNTLTGIHNAYFDKTPVVVITGMAEEIGHNSFQEVDILSVSKSCSKAAYIIDNTEDINKVLKLAFYNANKAPKGPVVVGVKKSVLESVVFDKKEFRLPHEIKVEAPHSCILKSLEMLKNAKRPLIIAGGGCRDAQNELKEFISLTHIPVVNTFMGKGIVDDLSFGLIGLNGDIDLNETIEHADIVLALGTRFSSRLINSKNNFLKNSKIININLEHNNSQNVLPEREIIGEMDIVLQHMIGVIKSKDMLFDIHYQWIEDLSKSDEYYEQNEFSSDYVMNEIQKYVKKYSPIITTDVGNHQICAMKYFKTESAKKFLTSGGFGTMGYGLPASIGAQIAKPNSLVMNITSDGSFQMNMQELGTCAEYDLPIKMIVINNSALGMIKNLQNQIYNKDFQSSMLNPDFVQIAHSYGIRAYSITTKEDLHIALKDMFKYKKAVLLDIHVKM